MFSYCSNLERSPILPATTLAEICYFGMFHECSNLSVLPKLPATTLTRYCYGSMFVGCSKIKISTSQTEEYYLPYRIPFNEDGTNANNALTFMFDSTGGKFTGPL